MTTPVTAHIQTLECKYTWAFAFGNTDLETNTVIWLAYYNPKDNAMHEYCVRAYTEQPLPHPEVFCEYRTQLYDSIGSVVSYILHSKGMFVTHISTTPGVTHVQS